jgi:two-component system sensor histidine kinase KdpD
MEIIKNKAKHYILSALLVVFMTLLGELGIRSLHPTNLMMLYLLLVVFVAIRWGRGPAISTAILGILAFDYFLMPPYFSFPVSDVQDIFALIGLLTVGICISELMLKMREQAEKVKQFEIISTSEKLQKAVLNSISHDLRTPLVSITGFLNNLRQDSRVLTETKKELMENACEQSDRLNRIVGNLLDMTRVEAGALKVSIKMCDLSDVLGVALNELGPKVEGRALEIHIPNSFPEIPMDFSLMVKVLVNILDNAIKYSEDDTPIQVDATSEGGRAEIAISDWGIGIPEKDAARVFEKFYRIEKLKEVPGIGLGLSIAKAITEAHQGTIQVLNRAKGTRFIISLPLEVLV